MTGLLIGYARESTHDQDFTAQKNTLVVTKLDRLARSLRDAKDIVDELTRREVKLSIGGSIHNPTDPVGRLLFNTLRSSTLNRLPRHQTRWRRNRLEPRYSANRNRNSRRHRST